MTGERKGELYILAESALWSFFPVITTLSYANLPSILALAWSSLFSAVFFGCIVAYHGTWGEMRNPALWRELVGVILFIGVLFYVFYFIGLETTTAGNAALIGQVEILTSFIFFHLIRREAVTMEHVFGAVLMGVGAFFVLTHNFSGFHPGDFFILAAVSVAPLGNFFQQRARKIASSATIMFARTVCASAIIFFLAWLMGKHASSEDVRHGLTFLLINGFLLLGLSKILWIEAIHQISVTKANALNGFTPLLTLLVAWVVLDQQPNLLQLLSLPFLLVGVLLLTGVWSWKRNAHSRSTA